MKTPTKVTPNQSDNLRFIIPLLSLLLRIPLIGDAPKVPDLSVLSVAYLLGMVHRVFHFKQVLMVLTLVCTPRFRHMPERKFLGLLRAGERS
jgi:hypothetical protein